MPNALHHVPEHLDLQYHHCEEPRYNKENLFILQTQAIKLCVFFIQKFSQGIKHIVFALKNTILGTCCFCRHVNINYCWMYLTEFWYTRSPKKSLVYSFMVKASNIIKYFPERVAPKHSENLIITVTCSSSHVCNSSLWYNSLIHVILPIKVSFRCKKLQEMCVKLHLYQDTAGLLVGQLQEWAPAIQELMWNVQL